MDDQLRAKYGGDDHEQIGMDPLGFIMDTPLPGVLHFLDSSSPTSPEEMVDELLSKVYSLA
jgi:hypothetical protein